MRRRRVIQYSRPRAEMNLTSMMDLTFLLLITFIITFPLIEQGLPVALPKGKAKPLETNDKPAVVTVDSQGRIYLGQTIVTLGEQQGDLGVIGSGHLVFHEDTGIRIGHADALVITDLAFDRLRPVADHTAGMGRQ